MCSLIKYQMTAAQCTNESAFTIQNISFGLVLYFALFALIFVLVKTALKRERENELAEEIRRSRAYAVKISDEELDKALKVA